MVDPALIRNGTKGQRLLLLGNEAIVRGGLEGGFTVFTSYPGTPASEILDVAAQIAEDSSLHAEYSINEKVAIDTAAGAAMNGLRAITSMKHVGLNVASDTFMALPYFAPKTALVIVVADDPAAYSSQNEQDTRNYGYFANLPMLEPADPQEAKDCVVRAAEISEALELPVLIRLDIRVSHVRGPVVLGAPKLPVPRKDFVKEKGRYTAIPPYPLKAHAALLAKLEKCKELSCSPDYVRVINRGSENGVISAGSASTHVLDARLPPPLQPDVLKMTMVNPLPEEAILKFLASHKKVLIVEELDPIFETRIKRLAYDNDLKTVILGKEAGIPSVGELMPSDVLSAMSTLCGIPSAKKASRILPAGPARPPVFCAGCPHRASMYLIKTLAGKNRVVVSDIGCYGMGALSPTDVGDVLLDMGFSIGAAGGFAIGAKQKPLAVIGDSTFLHAGIPALINAVWNKHDLALIILDNYITAMTGLQPNPSSGLDSQMHETERISIEDLVMACGVKSLKIIDPLKVKESKREIREMLDEKGVSVMILRQPCALLMSHQLRATGRSAAPYVVVAEDCNNCNACLVLASCPSLVPAELGGPGASGKVSVDLASCTGCGFCAEICPYGAIVRGGE
ncbi:MAG TPA: thiamine pyrophosphate-dependent enzyme [Conexivisphaerales archaeon]|nr:thiamine pyrophosphate-dependent enzyme [Conexivisphaerales archaeon]